MDIKIGLTDTPRELVISSSAQQDEVVARVNEALNAGTGVLDLVDERGAKFLLRVERIAYVEVGTSNPRTVGFVA